MKTVRVGIADEASDNLIRNTRYTWYSFVPLFLWGQFSSSALNVYFLLLACVQLVPGLAPTSPVTIWVPLLVILAVAAVKEAVDDVARARRDAECNARRYRLRDGSVCASGALQVGHVVLLSEGDVVPADGVVLSASESLFVETSMLDGEPDLKERRPIEGEASVVHVPLVSTTGIEWEGCTDTDVLIESDNVLLQSQTIATGDVTLLLTHTGRESAAGAARADFLPRLKWTYLDRELNVSVAAVFVVQLALCLALAAQHSEWTLDGQTLQDGFPVRFVRHLLLLSLMVPISLKVTVDLAKYFLSRFAETEAVGANNTSVIDELGSCAVACLDKTGTITSNRLEVEDLLLHHRTLLFAALATCHSATTPVPGEWHSTSPDESALLKCAQSAGWHFQKRAGSTLLVQGEEWVERAVLPFHSSRRHMAVVVESERQTFLFVKGADDVCLPMCDAVDEAAVRVEHMSRKGLRTLVVCGRLLSASEVAAVQGNRGARGAEQFALLERNLALYGVVGLRDELQERVPEVLSRMRHDGVQLYVLTGDRGSTAAAVAASAGLSDLVHFQGGAAALEASLPLGKNVVVSRCSPNEKALIVAKLQRHHRVLSIGDGGNDIAMLRAAHVSLGIRGREGAQAALAADFAIDSFKEVEALLLRHGRDARSKLMWMASLVFFKSATIALCQLCFQLLNSFSGTSFFSSLQLLFYNVFFTGIGILSKIFDHVPPSETFERVRKTRFVVALLKMFVGAVFAAAVVFSINVHACEHCQLSVMGLNVYITLLLVMNGVFAIETNVFTVAHVLFIAGPTVVAVALVLPVISVLPFVSDTGNYEHLDAFRILLGLVVCLLPFFVWRVILAWRRGKRVGSMEYMKLSDHEEDLL